MDEWIENKTLDRKQHTQLPLYMDEGGLDDNMMLIIVRSRSTGTFARRLGEQC